MVRYDYRSLAQPPDGLQRPRFTMPVVRGDPRIMAIRTGLSKTVAGHLIELERDTENKTARVVVRQMKPDAPVPTEVERTAIRVAAELLAQQARRFFGIGWTVKEWQGRCDACTPGLQGEDRAKRSN